MATLQAGRAARSGVVWASLGACVCLLWVFWPSLSQMAGRWIKDAEYSHGYIVPLFSAYLLWSQRGFLTSGPLEPSWWGLVILAGGLLLRFTGTFSFFDWLAAASIIP